MSKSRHAVGRIGSSGSLRTYSQPQRHPAKFSDSVLDKMTEVLWNQPDAENNKFILDPFAGIGKIHQLARGASQGAPYWFTIGVELEPEWAKQHPYTRVGNALALAPKWTDGFDVVATSPCYGNRMADHHEAKDGSRRNTYRHALERKLSDGNAGALQWGSEYRRFHEQAWAEARRVLKPHGLILVNISNHIRKGVEQPVTEWHISALAALGFRLRGLHRIETPRLRHGQNGDVRVDNEWLIEARLCQ